MTQSHKAISRSGGKKTLERHGEAWYSEIGQRGAVGKVNKYGINYYKVLPIRGQIGQLTKRFKMGLMTIDKYEAVKRQLEAKITALEVKESGTTPGNL